MTFVITENCKNCRFTDCVTVCPVNCFYGDDSMLYINPEECIDCGACEPECPVEAICDESNLSDDKMKWLKINEENSKFFKQVNKKEIPIAGAEKRKKDLGF